MTPELVSIVTPTLNAGRYLRETIDSVLAQTYRPIEYFLVDGGSTDDTLAIAREFRDRLALVERPGLTQAQAIEEGFRRARGEYYAFLNGDDLLGAHCIEHLHGPLSDDSQAPFAYADTTLIDERGHEIGAYPTAPFDRTMLASSCFISQPATLVRASAYNAVGGVDPSYHAAFDYDLWFRLSALAAPVFAPGVCAMARMHKESKSHRCRNQVLPEICRVVRRNNDYVPFSWIHAYAGVLATGKDLFFDPPSGSLRRSVLTLFLGLQHNAQRPLRFANEYLREVRRLRRLKRAR